MRLVRVQGSQPGRPNRPAAKGQQNVKVTNTMANTANNAVATAPAAKAARKPRAAKATAANALVVATPAATPAANVPALIPGAPLASNLPATGTLPAAHNFAGWLAMFTEMPAWPEMLAEMRAHKYGATGKGLVPCQSVMYANTAIGAGMAVTGTNKNGAPNVQAATARAIAIACKATGESKVCGAAVVYYMLTDESVLALLRGSKATKYVGKTGTPCPAWCSGYVRGNARAAFATAS
jgi:hypothetical protein